MHSCHDLEVIFSEFRTSCLEFTAAETEVQTRRLSVFASKGLISDQGKSNDHVLCTARKNGNAKKIVGSDVVILQKTQGFRGPCLLQRAAFFSTCLRKGDQLHSCKVEIRFFSRCERDLRACLKPTDLCSRTQTYKVPHHIMLQYTRTPGRQRFESFFSTYMKSLKGQTSRSLRHPKRRLYSSTATRPDKGSVFQNV